MKKYDFYCGLFWLFVALFVSAMGLKFGLGTPGYPGPGFFPFLVGIILAGLSLAIIILTERVKYKDTTFAKWPFFSKGVFFTLSILFAYSISLEFIGYILGSFFLMLYLFKVPGTQKWRLSLFLSVAMTALTYFFLGVLLQAQFPKGVFNLG